MTSRAELSGPAEGRAPAPQGLLTRQDSAGAEPSRGVTLVLLGGLLLIGLAIALPQVLDWKVFARSSPPQGLPPWHGYWNPHAGVGTLPAVLVAVGVIGWGPRLARRLSFGALQAAGAAASLAWLLSLAMIDGTAGLSRVLGSSSEYLQTARGIDDVPRFLATFVERIPADADGRWPVHVAGHPPGMTLFFTGLDRIGLGGDLAAGVVVTVLAASIVPAVLLTLRVLGVEDVARSAVGFLVLTPAALYLAVSADAVMTTVAAWGLAALALAAKRSLWCCLPAGLLLGALLLLSYGLALVGVIALAVLYAARSWRPLLPTALVALIVPLSFVPWGFWWVDGFVALHGRYWAGLAALRPADYWIWANLAVLVATVGPWAMAGLGRLRALPRAGRLLVLSSLAAVLLADLSMMSKGEVERIWLPFMPWLTLAAAALPRSWARPALVAQAGWALLLGHLLYTAW